ncbi:MAG TPA: cupin domain-containing protein [Frateuria sp.]|uniref:cupin domain-containing protein n=1 Tax=Frateuria sp. TaxID=2211372 RepID=UPI002D7F4CE2|nr:cupin domain-containing protein [Frateuria sp.]HET6806354.1 cupin domain-containing protein [Frateuria sp.]
MSPLARAWIACPLALAMHGSGAQQVRTPLQPTRMTPAAIAAHPALGAIAGTSGLAGIRTVVLAGDPARPGAYAIELLVPPHTRIDAHTHRDDRTAVVVSGTWHFGYGGLADDAGATSLGPGSFYTEPANTPHFAHTGNEAVAVIISGNGPTDTHYVARPGDNAAFHRNRP